MTRPATAPRPSKPRKASPARASVPAWVSEGRPVVVCADGPLQSRWYFADDWARMVAAAQHLVDVGGQDGSVYLEYVETSGTQPHPTYAVVGQVLRWRHPRRRSR